MVALFVWAPIGARGVRSMRGFAGAFDASAASRLGRRAGIHDPATPGEPSTDSETSHRIASRKVAPRPPWQEMSLERKRRARRHARPVKVHRALPGIVVMGLVDRGRRTRAAHSIVAAPASRRKTSASAARFVSVSVGVRAAISASYSATTGALSPSSSSLTEDNTGT